MPQEIKRRLNYRTRFDLNNNIFICYTLNDIK